MEIKGINKDKIQQELDSIILSEGLNEVEDLLRAAIYEDTDDKLIEIMQDDVIYSDLGKGYNSRTAVVKLVRPKLYVRFGYVDTSDDTIIENQVLEQVFAYPKRRIVYEQ